MPILELYKKDAELPDTYHPYTLQRVKIYATLETSTHKDTCGWCTDEICRYEVEEVEMVFDWKPIWYSTVDYETGDIKDDYGIYTEERYFKEKQIDRMLCENYHKPEKEIVFDNNENLSELYFTENDIHYWMTVLPIPTPARAFADHDRCSTCNESLAKGLFGGDFKYTIHRVEILKRFELNELNALCENNDGHYKCAYYCRKCRHDYGNQKGISPHIIHKIKRILRKPYPNKDRYVYINCKQLQLNMLQQMAREMNINMYAKKSKEELYDDIIGVINSVRESGCQFYFCD